MKTVPLGSTGVGVSTLCLGAMFLGTKSDVEDSRRILDLYLEAGGTFIDTANIYAHWVPGFKGGESEVLLGDWMKEKQNRSKLFIASKVGFGYPGVPVGLTAKQIESECEKSLKRMQIETIDLYYAHVDDPKTPMEETMEAFERLVKAGKVRFIGASNFSAWRMERAKWISQTKGWASYCCVQQRYTYLQPRPGTNFGMQMAVNDDLLDYCRDTGTTLLAYSALLAGAYTRPEREISSQYAGADNQMRMEALKTVAGETGASVNQVLLAWMLHSDPFVLPLIAASTEEQLKDNLGALDLHLSEDQMNRLNHPLN